MASNTYPSLPALPGRRGFLTLVALAAGLVPAGPASALGGAEFEAVILDEAPPISQDLGTSGVVNGGGQLAYVGGADPLGSVVVYVEVDTNGYSWSTLEDPTRALVPSDINGSGTLVFKWSGEDDSLGVSQWSPDAGETPIASYPDTPVRGPAITDDGTVVWIAGLAYRWNEGGSPQQIGANPGELCPIWGFDRPYASPGGRIAQGYGEGFLCTGGVGVVSWDDPLAPPTFSGPLWPLCSQKVVWGITDSGKVLVDGLPRCGFSSWYDLGTGELEPLPFSNSSLTYSNNDEWVALEDGSLSRNGSNENLIDLVSGITNIHGITAMGDNGHFLVISVIDGDRVPVLIRPSACEGDTNGDGNVDVDDLINVVLDWGGDGSENGGDVDGSGLVDVDDVVLVLLNWGPC